MSRFDRSVSAHKPWNSKSVFRGAGQSCTQSFYDLMNRGLCTCCRSNTVEPVRSCSMCFEEGARKRICCNAIFCDHCYTKDKQCPNCGTTTKQEKLTGATYVLPLYSEHEECRVCLEPGLKRPCCSNYFCDECYYAAKSCRSCGTPIGDKRLYRLLKGVNISILVGWLVTIFTILVVIALTSTIAANELATPLTLSGYKCYGLFRKCELNVCIDMPRSVANGTESFPPLSNWKYCDIDSYAKLQSTACIFDQQLYDATDHMMGYDICVDEFTPGVYVFEDGFEDWANSTWQSNQMKSALWSNIVNGHATSYCGSAPSHTPNGDPSNGGTKSLSFSGGLEVQERYAETRDVELSGGGWLEYRFLLSPIGWDVTRPYCKTNYNGDVFVEYSLDGGESWTQIVKYTASEYRSATFLSGKYEVNFPAQRIRFRFNQPTFSVNSDGWALDNVRVFRRQPADWATATSLKRHIAQAKEEEQYAQCCFDTDWCETRMSPHQMKKCGQTLPWYQQGHYQMRNAEMVLLMVVFVNILKFIYVSVKDYLMRNRFPFQDEFEDLTYVDFIMKRVPARFRPKKSLGSTQSTSSNAAFVANIHSLARLGGEAKSNLSDIDGIGDRMKQKFEIEEEKEAKRLERMHRLKKKIERREQYLKLKNNRFAKQAALDLQKEIDADVEEAEEEKKQEVDATKYGTGIMTTDIDKIKRSDMSMLRIAFDLKVSNERFVFAAIVVGILGIMTLVLISVTSFYIVSKTISPFGLYSADISLTSFGINFLALMCDVKEVFWTIKSPIPIRDSKRLDLITIDRSDEINSLFIGPYTIPLEEIQSINNFTRQFALTIAFAYLVGCFPWNIMSLVLRNVYLNFDNMRIVTPIFAGITVLRALLGPGIFVKMAFTFSYFFSAGFKKRELIGIACQARRTPLGAVHGCLAFTGIMIIISAAFAADYIGEAVATAFVTGAMYGAFTAVTHSLPIKPYFQFTTFNEGVFLVLKRKESCPCVYWCSYCTDMHETIEVCIVYTTNDFRFVDTIKSGNASLY